MPSAQIRASSKQKIIQLMPSESTGSLFIFSDLLSRMRACSSSCISDLFSLKKKRRRRRHLFSSSIRFCCWLHHFHFFAFFPPPAGRLLAFPFLSLMLLLVCKLSAGLSRLASLLLRPRWFWDTVEQPDGAGVASLALILLDGCCCCCWRLAPKSDKTKTRKYLRKKQLTGRHFYDYLRWQLETGRCIRKYPAVG